jgi:lipoprotein-anchoring transpeptidase ErfK/SrfK
MRRRSLVLILIVALACAAAPDAARTPQVAPGVRLGAVDLSGLTAEAARTLIASSLAKPIPVVAGDVSWYAWPDRIGLRTSPDGALTAALTARPDERLAVPARWSQKRVDRFVAQVASGFDRPGVPARLVTVAHGKPVIREARAGIAVNRTVLARELAAELRTGSREAVSIPTRSVRATKTRATFGPVIWIDRATNTLRLYDSTKLTRVFRVATGRSQYPTPSGMWRIVDKQRDPWWRPPDSPWAAGAVPIPPGPGNPLGTRWMGLDASGVGIHGTPDAASIGYSASHGCIRMHISDAEWLFGHVDLGTPVYIT